MNIIKSLFGQLEERADSHIRIPRLPLFLLQLIQCVLIAAAEYLLSRGGIWIVVAGPVCVFLFMFARAYVTSWRRYYAVLMYCLIFAAECGAVAAALFIFSK